MLMYGQQITEKFSSLGLGEELARSQTPHGETRL